MKDHPPLLVRVLAILASICLIVSFAIALLLPPTLSLAAVIARADHLLLVGLQDAVRGGLGDWAWKNLAVPLLARPGWLFPLALALLLGAAAITFASRQTAPHSRHRRP